MRRKLYTLLSSAKQGAFALVFAAIPTFVFAQQTYTFNTCGATGRIGPTQALATTAYGAGNSLNGLVTITGTTGIQQFTLPQGGIYRITVYGAKGGDNSSGPSTGGLGAKMQGEFILNSGAALNILVGQHGENYNANTGGGGGTFVWINGQTNPLIVAGGGGGAGYGYNGVDASITTSGTVGNPSGLGTPGVNGNGASQGGAGWFTDGGNYTTAGGCPVKCAGNTTNLVMGGASPLTAITFHGCAAASTTGDGGFGGGTGGAGACTSSYGAGGGGGYSGGIGQAGASAGGGGGGSYNGGTNQNNLAGNNSGDGKVIIEQLCTPPSAPISTSSSSNILVCTDGSGGVAAMGVSGTGTINWYNVPSGGVPVSTGSNYQTVVPSGDTAFYYAESFVQCGSARLPFRLINSLTPIVSILTSTDQVCFGGSVLMTAQGTASNYTWTANGSTSPVFIASPSATGVYTLIGVSAAGCTNTAIQPIKVNATPELYAISASNGGYICRDDNGINLTASGASANTYTWTGGDGLFFVGQSAFVSPKETTTYTVYGANQYGCVGSTTILQLVDGCTGIKEAKGNIENLSVYPNPNNGEFTLELSNGIAKTVEVIDVMGRMVFSKNSDNDAINIDIKEFSAGVYYVKVKSGDASKVLKIVKQ